MTQIVTIPGQGEAEFPDGMSQADIVKVIRKQFPVMDEKAKRPSAMDSIRDKAAGAVEAVQGLTVGPLMSALGATGGALGAATAAGVRGELGTPAAAERISQGAGEGAERLTPQPQTQTGQDILGGIARKAEDLKVPPVVTNLTQAANVFRGAGQAAQVARPAVAAAGEAVAAVPEAVKTGVAKALTPMPEPRVAALAKKAVDLGIPLRPDQLSKNPIARMVGETLEKVPLSGSKAKQRQVGFNRALGTLIGAEESDHLTPDVFAAAMEKSGGRIGEISAQTPIRADGDFIAMLDERLKGMSKETRDTRLIVRSYVNDLKEAGKDGVIDGTLYRKINSQIGDQLRRTPDGDLRHALAELQSDLIDTLEKNIQSPEVLADLKQAKKQYAIGLTIEPLVAKATTTGDISPGGLLGRVTADKAGKRRMARGRGGELGDLAEIGKLFLKEPPSSGTAERALAYGTVGGLSAGAFLEPHTAAAAGGAIAGANVYNRVGPGMVRRALQDVEPKKGASRQKPPPRKEAEQQFKMRDAYEGETRFYHGSPRKGLKELRSDAEHTTMGGFSKYGVSITPDEKVASRYAKDFGKGQVYEVEHGAKKTLSLTAGKFEKLQNLVSKIDAGVKLTESEDIDIEMMLKSAGVKDTSGHPVEAIKRAGFDSISKDAGRHGIAEAELLIFDNGRVKIKKAVGE